MLWSQLILNLPNCKPLFIANEPIFAEQCISVRKVVRSNLQKCCMTHVRSRSKVKKRGWHFRMHADVTLWYHVLSQISLRRCREFRATNSHQLMVYSWLGPSKIWGFAMIDQKLAVLWTISGEWRRFHTPRVERSVYDTHDRTAAPRGGGRVVWAAIAEVDCCPKINLLSLCVCCVHN